VHEINAQGEIVNVRTVFDGANKPGDRLSSEISLEPGTEVSLGIIAAGTQLGFVLVNDGFDGWPLSIWETGTLEFRNPETGRSARSPTDRPTTRRACRFSCTSPRRHRDGDQRAAGLLGRCQPADAQQQPAQRRRRGALRLGLGRREGILVVGVEDRWGANAESVPGRIKDNDFNDLVFGVRFGSSRGRCW
jgi:hypothetical protein